MKQNENSSVRVNDLTLDLHGRGTIRILLYLEDSGRQAKWEPGLVKMPAEHQVTWQLEIWKRSEMSRFMAHLKQKELNAVEEAIAAVKKEEAEREAQFT